jgi:hypothetical protein
VILQFEFHDLDDRHEVMDLAGYGRRVAALQAA